MKLSDYLDMDKLMAHIEAGYVSVRRHNSLPLTILCYTKKATLDHLWDDVTTKTRGLIVADDNNEIIARPFEKFWNFMQQDRPETWLSNLPKEAPTITEKIDGNLAILYRYPLPDGRIFEGIASKGSFRSDHARWAMGWYKKHVKAGVWPKGFTPVFEEICESVQRHPVSYGGEQDGLILIGLVNVETGEEMPYKDLTYWAVFNKLRVVPVYQKSVGDVIAEDRENREGYILTWRRPGQTALKIKVKHPGFLKTQKLFHHTSPKVILEALVAGNLDLIDAWTQGPSKELNLFVQTWFERFTANYAGLRLAARSLVYSADALCATRKEVAAYINHPDNRHLAPIAFALLDGKDASGPTWRLVEAQLKNEMAKDNGFEEEAEDAEEVEAGKGVSPWEF